MKILSMGLLIILLPPLIQDYFEQSPVSITTLPPGTVYYGNGLAIARSSHRNDIDMKVLSGQEFGFTVNCRMIGNAGKSE
jgi:hypothetical protein